MGARGSGALTVNEAEVARLIGMMARTLRVVEATDSGAWRVQVVVQTLQQLVRSFFCIHT
jgi:hypothetical protein